MIDWNQTEIDLFWPLRIHAGSKALESLPHEMERLGVRAPLLVAETREQARRTVSAFRGWDAVLTVADPIDPDADLQAAAALAGRYRNHQCDGWVAVGSGRWIDQVRCANLMVSGGLETPEAVSAIKTCDFPFRPLAIVPDLRLCGWETSRFLRHPEFLLNAPGLVPAVAIVDERVAVPAGAQELLSASLYALGIAVEGFVSRYGNPLVQAYAAAVIHLIAHNLLTCVHRPRTVSAREAVAVACVLSGSVLSDTGPGSVLRMGEAVAAGIGPGPGIASGILLPHFVSLLALREEPAAGDLLEPLAGVEKYASTSFYLRGAVAANLLFAMHYDLHHAAVEALPLTLQESGLNREDLPQIVEAAADSEPAREICRAVLEHAWSGHPIVAM